jgi:hypothetical protein
LLIIDHDKVGEEEMRYLIENIKQNCSKVALPIIKNMLPSFSAKDFISLQPMTVPTCSVIYMDLVYGIVIIIFDEELWWEEDEKGEWYCPQTLNDHKINDHEWRKQLDDWLVIPKWEVDQQIKYKDGMGNKQEKPFGYYPIDNIPFVGNQV